MDLTGKWHFFELFANGFDFGVAVLQQNGDKLLGTLIYREFIHGDDSFMLSVDVDGEVCGDAISLYGRQMELYDTDVDYCFDDRQGLLINRNRIEGQSIDEQGEAAQFFMQRFQE